MRGLSFSAWTVVLLLAGAPGLLSAQTEANSGPAWASVSPRQRAALQPLAKDWNRLTPDARLKWIEIATRLPSMPADQQKRVQERMNEWARMSPAERGEARLNFQQTKQLPAQDRQASWEAYQALPAQQRAALAAKASPGASAAQHRPDGQGNLLRSAPVAAQAPKSNIVGAPLLAGNASKSVTPTVVQGNPGATTSLVSARPMPPAHQPAGQPKISANPSLVDRSTLLPIKTSQLPQKPTVTTPAAGPSPGPNTPAPTPTAGGSTPITAPSSQ